MQGLKDLWKKCTSFLEGGIEDEDDWDDQGYGGYENPYDIEPQDEIDLEGAQTAKYGRGERTKKPSSNVVDFDTRRDPKDSVTVMILRPKVMQDATLVCDHLKDNRVCIIDMKEAEHLTAQRIADYLGGVSYALRGHVERIDTHTFVMAPEGVKIDSDFREELESGGWFKKSFKAQV